MHWGGEGLPHAGKPRGPNTGHPFHVGRLSWSPSIWLRQVSSLVQAQVSLISAVHAALKQHDQPKHE